MIQPFLHVHTAEKGPFKVDPSHKQSSRGQLVRIHPRLLSKTLPSPLTRSQYVVRWGPDKWAQVHNSGGTWTSSSSCSFSTVARTARNPPLAQTSWSNSPGDRERHFVGFVYSTAMIRLQVSFGRQIWANRERRRLDVFLPPALKPAVLLLEILRAHDLNRTKKIKNGSAPQPRPIRYPPNHGTQTMKLSTSRIR